MTIGVPLPLLSIARSGCNVASTRHRTIDYRCATVAVVHPRCSCNVASTSAPYERLSIGVPLPMLSICGVVATWPLRGTVRKTIGVPLPLLSNCMHARIVI